MSIDQSLQLQKSKIIIHNCSPLIIHLPLHPIGEAVKNQYNRIMAYKARSNTILYPLRFRFISAKQPIKNHKNATVVFININGITTMMNPMRRRRINNPF